MRVAAMRMIVRWRPGFTIVGRDGRIHCVCIVSSVVRRRDHALGRDRLATMPRTAHHHARADRAPDWYDSHQQQQKKHAERSTHQKSLTPAAAIGKAAAFADIPVLTSKHETGEPKEDHGVVLFGRSAVPAACGRCVCLPDENAR